MLAAQKQVGGESGNLKVNSCPVRKEAFIREPPHSSARTNRGWTLHILQQHELSITKR